MSAARDSLDPLAAAPEGSSLRQPARSPFLKNRLYSLDAYRGLIMVTLAFSGFGLAATAGRHLDHNMDEAIWKQVQFQFTHVEWVGCSYWDLIQPSFMFMVGASMAFSYAKRQSLGHSYARMFAHAVWRSVVLIAIGVFLASNWSDSTNWSFMNVLAQIGLGYTFLFLFWNRSARTQAEGVALILVATWLAYYFYPDAGLDVQQGKPDVGVSAEWAQENLAAQDVDPPWHKNANVGQYVDQLVLNQIPREEPFRYNRGGYQTINFIPSLATMLLGLMCGELLRSDRKTSYKLLMLLLAGGGGLLSGWLLHISGFCPVVKRIWTPSFALYSAGWCFLIMFVLFLIIDAMGLRFWAWPLRVVGLNSIAIYLMSQLLKPWVRDTLETHVGDRVFQLQAKWGGEYYELLWLDRSHDPLVAMYQPTIQAVMVGLVFWLICFWMYRQRIFVRI